MLDLLHCLVPVKPLRFYLVGSAVVNSRVESDLVVSQFDVTDDVFPRVLSRRVLGTVDSLVLQGTVKRLGPGVVVANTGTHHGALHTQLLANGREFRRKILAATVAMEDSRAGPERNGARGHTEGIGH